MRLDLFDRFDVETEFSFQNSKRRYNLQLKTAQCKHLESKIVRSTPVSKFPAELLAEMDAAIGSKYYQRYQIFRRKCLHCGSTWATQEFGYDILRELVRYQRECRELIDENAILRSHLPSDIDLEE